MFSFIADGLTVATTVLFPIFASYKALHTSDPALLAPWLIYFVVLSILTIVENTFDFILSWVPFYSWIRFFIHLYLILPGSQGASFLYQEYIEPFLYHHEREIDDFISESHDRARKAGMVYIEMGIEWVKVNLLGFAPRQPDQPRPAGQTYAQSLMTRFQMPSARGSNDLYGLVNQALSGASALYGAGNKDAQAADLSRGAARLVPDSIRNNDDRLNYVTSQRQRLETLLQAFDHEQENIRTQQSGGSRYYESSSGGLSRNRSEAEFDRIERDEISSGSERPPYPTTPPPLGRQTSTGWMPWNWQRQTQPYDDPLAYGKEPGDSRSSDIRNRARASGFDLGDR
ncbi:receptor expression-enhancing protein 2 [Cucurbitaria berberidis CBS 394.84]|uniref:Protein YOP1 n=1 Tax=Cucurbitaria berberidis CBS 394.84 TaxID=1168544 RepID=A0A9P4L5H3_9PLEO|nr:receptor expression-enhancing protein 2 [Cucurbitaria berberidis CBS 394.84]KAF1841973.1 receptor expression-enhancing protein 2 [Cucurbitaria berberidis CBS 394.84]